MPSDAMKRAIKKYNENFDVIRFKVPAGQSKLIKQYAKKHGESVNKMMNRLVKEEMSKENISDS